MKNLIKTTLLLVSLTLSSSLFAQISFSCNAREYGYWNEVTKEFGNFEGYKESSLFTFNEAETLFTHTTESITSTYYIQSSEYDEEYDVYAYKVISDVGNEYQYIFDPANREIRALSVKGGPYIIRFYVKAIF